MLPLFRAPNICLWERVFPSLGTAIVSGLIAVAPLTAQVAGDTVRPAVQFGDRGLTFNAPDGVTSLNLRFRVQQWAILSSASDDDLTIDRTQIQVRRARLRLESTVWDPRLRVNLQFSFSRGDQDFENSNFPNLLRDAYVTWQSTPRLALVAGQGKLPGNRQRVISSSELQFADRSIVNAAFTVDRDVGVFANYQVLGGPLPFAFRAAVSSGEGRNAPTGDGGLAYTVRAEAMPLGVFTAGGDYFEGDLRREITPRLAIGVALSHNDRAVRTGGQLGRPLFEARSMSTAFVDAVYKHRGFSASGEYARRIIRNPMTTDGVETRYALSGDGATVQFAWLTRAMIEPAVRYSVVTPHRDLAGETGADRQRQASFGVTRYLKGHRVKMQGELMHDDFRNALTGVKRGFWSVRTSLEVGI